jgi:hypothetical protein
MGRDTTMKNNHHTKLRGIALALSILVSSQALVFAQIGPPDPKKPEAATPGNKPIDQVKSSFMKLFKKEDLTSAPKKEASDKPQGDLKVKGEEDEPDNAEDSPKAEAKSQPKVSHPPLLSSPEDPDAKIETPVVSPENPPQKLVTLDNPNNPLGFTDAETKLNQVAVLIDRKDFIQAKSYLQPLRQWLIDSTEAHINLYKTLSNIPSARAQAELEKQLALQFAILRDKAIFNQGMIEISQKNYKAAVKELTEVVKSQPRGAMGIKSYQLLQEIGFTEKLQLAQ